MWYNSSLFVNLEAIMNDKAWFDRAERRRAEQRKLAGHFVNNSSEEGVVILDEESENQINPASAINANVVAKNDKIVKMIISAYKEIFSGKTTTEPLAKI